jgi:hypothetical protein
MAQTTAKSGQPVRNNGAVVPRGGAIVTGGPVTSAPDTLTQGYTSRGVGGTTVLSKTGANIGTQKAVTANAFARQMVAGQYVMMRYGYIAGSATNFLNSGAADFGRRSIHGKTNRRSYHITSWNYVTGAATKGADTNDDMGSDHAAIPTRAIPGELTYTDHGMAATGALAVPLNDDYDAKTG